MSKFLLQDRVLNVRINEDIFDMWWAFSASVLQDNIDFYRGRFDKVKTTITSAGGSVPEGFAIRNIFQSLIRDGIEVEMEIAGMAASIAGIIALSGSSKPKQAVGSYLMIHRPWTFTEGDFEELQNTAATVKKMNDDLVTVYVASSNLSRDEVEAFMKKETWFTADEAEKFNFSEKLVLNGDSAILNSISNHQDGKSSVMSHFDNVPENILKSGNPNINRAAIGPENKGDGMDKQLKALLDGNPKAKADFDAAVAKASANQIPAENGVPPVASAQAPAPAEPVTTPVVAKGEEPFVSTGASAAKASAKVIATSGDYPKAIQDVAVAFLCGDSSVDVFQACVASFDATIQAQASSSAQGSTAAIGDNPATAIPTAIKGEEVVFMDSEAAVMSYVKTKGE